MKAAEKRVITSYTILDWWPMDLVPSKEASNSAYRDSKVALHTTRGGNGRIAALSRGAKRGGK